MLFIVSVKSFKAPESIPGSHYIQFSLLKPRTVPQSCFVFPDLDTWEKLQTSNVESLSTGVYLIFPHTLCIWDGNHSSDGVLSAYMYQGTENVDFYHH